MKLLGPLILNENDQMAATTAWVQTNAWTVDGNAGTNPATQYIGTSDNQPLMFGVNGVLQAELTATGAFRLAYPTAGGITGTERLIINDATGTLSDFSFVAAGGGYPTFNLGASGGTPTARTALSATGNLGNHLWWGYDGTTWVQCAEQIVTANSVATGNIPATFKFNVNGTTIISMTSAGASLSGTITATTAPVNTNTTQIATTAYVMSQGYLTAATAASTYAPLASPSLTGNPTATTQAVSDNSTRIATTAFVYTLGAQLVGSYAPLASPTLSGVPTSPTAAVNTNTTQVATTAYVLGQVGTANPLMDGSVAVGSSYLYSRQDHVHPSDSSKANLASPTFTGVVSAPSFTSTIATGTAPFSVTSTTPVTNLSIGGNAATATNSLQLGGVVAASYALLNDPTFTGTPASTTPTLWDNSTNIATTAFVQQNATYSLDSVYQAGTASIESWYPAGISGSAPAMTTLALTTARLYAIPFYISQQKTLDRLGFYINTKITSSTAHIGIYKSSGSNSLYPTSLVYDSGALSTGTVGIMSTSISQALTPGLYWFVIFPSSNPTVNAFAATAACAIFGYPNSLNGTAQTGLYVAATYGALPATFPTGATALNSTFPAIFCRFSV